MRPHVAVSATFLTGEPTRAAPFNGRPVAYCEQHLLDWLSAAGAVPAVVSTLAGRPTDVTYDDVMARFDGLVLQGGIDIWPGSYGEQPRHPDWSGDRRRDEFEIGLIRAAMRANKPILGICRGHQLLNVALGGTLHQDIPSDVPGALTHQNREIQERNRHEVAFRANGFLHRLFGVTTATVNSLHHQAIKDLAPGLEILARAADDDVIESVWLPVDSHDDPWVLGIQWHPELQDPADTSLLATKPITDALFDAIRARS